MSSTPVVNAGSNTSWRRSQPSTAVAAMNAMSRQSKATHVNGQL